MDLVLIANRCKFERDVICMVHYTSMHSYIDLEVLRSNARPYKILLAYARERCQKNLQKIAAACGNEKQFEIQSRIPAYSYPLKYQSPSKSALFLFIYGSEALHIT